MDLLQDTHVVLEASIDPTINDKPSPANPRLAFLQSPWHLSGLQDWTEPGAAYTQLVPGPIGLGDDFRPLVTGTDGDGDGGGGAPRVVLGTPPRCPESQQRARSGQKNGANQRVVTACLPKMCQRREADLR